ncbi:MAG: ComF family protein [Candidatus Cloacimonadaceae bacterium]|nr:ComF family protein [Candidatus Cloacimonadaceae bacterium]
MLPLLDLLFPPACFHCHGRMETASLIVCDTCLELNGALDEDVCKKCGTPLESEDCDVCAENEFYFDIARAAYRFSGPMQTIIHQLKYNGMVSPVSFIVKGMQTTVNANAELSDIDFITAVPLHRVRRRERGFNQSELLARALAKALGVKYADPVSRHQYTESQTRLHKQQRIKNLGGAFKLRHKADLTNKRVLLIDDVFTTGSTVNEVSQVLKSGGAGYIAVLTAARAV